MDALNNSLRPVAAANMASTACMSILYGAYMLVFPVCLYVLLGQRAPGQPISWVLITAVALQFIVTTMNLVASHITMFNSFVALADRPNALMEIVLYWTMKTPASVKISHVCSVMNMALGDAILVWRVWILFHGRVLSFCFLPILTLVGSTACGIALVHGIWHSASQTFFRYMALAGWALTLITQVYSTSLIAFEIWRRGILNTSASRRATSYYNAIMIMIIESGAIYTAVVLPLTVTYMIGTSAVVGSSAALVLAGALGPISAIIPASIVIRVGMNRNRQFQTTMLSQVVTSVNTGKPIEGDTGIGISFAKSQHSTTTDRESV